MNSTPADSVREPVVLPPGQGRAWPMGRIGAVFKADGAERLGRYSISEWWPEPHAQGPGEFEQMMPAISGWFREHPPADAGR